MKIGDKVVTPGGKVGTVDFIEDGYVELTDGSAFENASMLKPYVEPVVELSPYEIGNAARKHRENRPMPETDETLFGHEFSKRIILLAAAYYYTTNYVMTLNGDDPLPKLDKILDWKDLNDELKMNYIAIMAGCGLGQDVIRKLDDEKDDFRMIILELMVYDFVGSNPRIFLS